MLGTIIGDLAAWTYENAPSSFFSDLVSPEAVLSEYGTAAMEAAMAIATGNLRHLKPVDCTGYGLEECGPRLIQSLQAAWCDPSLGVCSQESETIRAGAGDKAGLYFVHIAVDGIHKLRSGAAKHDIDDNDGCFSFKIPMMKAKMSKISDHDSDEVLLNLGFAKEALDESWDFTSAIHCASYKPGNRHFLFSIVGALADAMYGCKYRLLKSDYTSEVFKLIPIPSNISPECYKIHDFDFNNRFFFPKNEARTNSERIKWMPLPCSLEHKSMSSETALKLRKAFIPWKDEYGIYLENGWQYVYSSGNLLARFRLVKGNMGTFIIEDVQCTQKSHDMAESAILDVFNEIGSITSV